MMKIGNYQEFISIIEQERLPDNTPTPGDVRLKVSVCIKEFSGSYENVWIDKDELKKFLLDFIKLEERREGRARLESMSPDEFWMEFRSIDRAGHVGVEVQLKRLQYSESELWPRMIAGGFEFDVSTLPQLVREFKKLVS